MKIKSVEKVVLTIKTEEGGQYERHPNGDWTEIVGNKRMAVYECEELEKTFQQFITNKQGLDGVDCVNAL